MSTCSRFSRVPEENQIIARYDEGYCVKIALNALSVYSGGGFTSFCNLLPALDRADRTNEYTVIISRFQTHLVQSIPEEFRVRYVRFNPRILWRRLFFEQVIFPFLLWKLQIDWLYSTGNVTALLAPCKVLLLVESANPYSSLRVTRPLREKIRLVALRVLGYLSVKRATKIRFLSENSRQIISRKHRIPAQDSCVIYHGVNLQQDSNQETPRPATIPGKYILTVADIMPHKNIHALMDAFEILSTRFRYNGSLIIAGASIYPFYSKVLLEKKNVLTCGPRIMFLGWVEPGQVSALYRSADLFVMPSLEETFCLPVIEAMARGTPTAVPAEQAGYEGLFFPYRELCGDAVAYFNPFDPSEIANCIHAVMEDRSYYERLIYEGKLRAKRYDWNKTAAAIVDIFRETY